MNSSKKTKMSDSGALYTPPRVVRISDLRQGAGGSSCESGSGDVGTCSTGNNAVGFCEANGNGFVPLN